MIIQSDNIRTGASRSFHSAHAGYTRHDAWDASGNTLFSIDNAFQERQSVRSSSKNGQTEEKGKDSDGGINANADPDTGSMQDLMEQMSSASTRRIAIADAISNLKKLRQQTLDYLLDMLFGRRSRSDTLEANRKNNTQQLSATGSSLYGAGERYTSFFYYSERETTCFDARGTAVTADGRTIPFSINLEMSRSFTQIAGQQIDFGKPQWCDPLVINLSGSAADVSDQKFFFDLDADGETEEISSLGAGNGYLALDKNEDGVINDGSELFGTKSGNGFADLAAYDEDGNGWIDEADAIFSKLRIWAVNERGENELISLRDANVGAICLRHENTEFSLNSAGDNHTNAIVRQSGFFLYEDGGTGSIQQLDLTT